MRGAGWLDQLIGDWTYETRSEPDRPEHRRTGTETVTRRGVWIVIESSDGGRFQLASDPSDGGIVGDFVHRDHSDLWVCDGAVEDGRLHLRSRGPSLDVDGGTTDYDDVTEMAAPDHRVMTSRLRGADGQWRDFMVTVYRRESRSD